MRRSRAGDNVSKAIFRATRPRRCRNDYASRRGTVTFSGRLVWHGGAGQVRRRWAARGDAIERCAAAHVGAQGDVVLYVGTGLRLLASPACEGGCVASAHARRAAGDRGIEVAAVGVVARLDQRGGLRGRDRVVPGTSTDTSSQPIDYVAGPGRP